jgi:hypothetical protein
VRSASYPELTYRTDRKTAIGYTSNRYTRLSKPELFEEDFRAFTQDRVDGLGKASLEGKTWEEHCLDGVFPLPVADSPQVLPHDLERPAAA